MRAAAQYRSTTCILCQRPTDVCYEISVAPRPGPGISGASQPAQPFPLMAAAVPGVEQDALNDQLGKPLSAPL